MTTTTSRRALLAGIASVAPAVALPAIATTMPAAPTPTSRQVSGPTAIDLLWKQRQAINREYKKAHRLSDELEAEFERRLPKPHPSITHSPENDADDLKFYLPRTEPDTPNHYIRSTAIEGAIDRLEGTEFSHLHGERILYLDRKTIGPRPLSEEEEMLRNRLLARLKLSKEYEQKFKQVRDEIGLTAVTDKIENSILPRLGQIERRIYSTPAVTQSDLKRKLAIYDTDELDEYTAKRLLRDLRRLAKLDLLPNEAQDAVQS